MQRNEDLPNTYIDENGAVTFVDVFELNENDMDQIAKCERCCGRIEKKYQTTDVIEMMKRNAKRSEVVDYIMAKHDLLMLYGE